MNILESLRTALGRPLVLWKIEHDRRVVAAVGRWRHHGACVDLSDSGAIQLVFNISGGQLVEFRSSERSVRNDVRAGSVGVVRPGMFASVAISGYADAVQILLANEFVDAVRLNGPERTQARLESLLQRSAARAYVALANGAEAELKVSLVHIARLLGLGGRPPAPRVRGGLAPGARRRVQALIARRMASDPSLPPTLAELARAAGLSVHHFIRAFRATEGETPCASVARRRVQEALPLLLCRDARVDGVADLLGYSSPSHFVSAFRQHMGVTPGALRDATSRLSWGPEEGVRKGAIS